MVVIEVGRGAAGQQTLDVVEREANVSRCKAALTHRWEAAHEVLDTAGLGDVQADGSDDTAAQRDHATISAEFSAPDGEPYVQDDRQAVTENPTTRWGDQTRRRARSSRVTLFHWMEPAR